MRFANAAFGVCSGTYQLTVVPERAETGRVVFDLSHNCATVSSHTSYAEKGTKPHVSR